MSTPEKKLLQEWKRKSLRLLKNNWCVLSFPIGLSLSGCTSESETAITPKRVDIHSDLRNEQKIRIALDSFKCHAGFVRSRSAKEQLEEQARAILLSHLQQSKIFRIQESQTSFGVPTHSPAISAPARAPKYIVAGNIIEFGRKETSGWVLWGLLATSKKQVAYAKINLNILNAATYEVVHSVQGAGQFHFNERDYVAASFSGTSSFDWVISGKVLELAIIETVNRLSGDISRGDCRLE
jgi:curli biogenesis system outer membrane secretion channel CsgG